MKHDFEQIRDNIEKEFVITAANEAVGHDPELAASFMKRDLGIKAMQVVDQAWDGQTNQDDINKAIRKTNKPANKESKKDSAAKDFIKAFLSEGYYGYMCLRKMIGHPLEHPVLRPWYAAELFRIPSLVNPGGKVYLTEGTFSLSAQITPLNNLVLEGSGWQHTKLLMAASGNAIGLGAYDNITIRELEIDGNSRAYTHTEVISGNGNDDVTIEKIYMHDHAAAYGIELWNASRLRVLDSRFTKNGQTVDSDPISIQASTDVRIDGNYVYDNVYEYRAGGIEVQESSGRVTIINNHIRKSMAGIKGDAHTGYTAPVNYIIANNHIEVYNLDGEVNRSYAAIGISADSDALSNVANMMAFGNNIKFNAITGATTELVIGIITYNIKYGMISNNIIDGIASNQEKGKIGIDVYSVTPVERLSICNNVIINCELEGINIDAANGITVIGNTCHGNDVGINVTDGDYIDMLDNVVYGNTTNGIVIAAGKNTNGRVINNHGYNPVGNFTAPSVPASTVNYTNAYGYPCMVQVTGGTVTEIDIDDIATGLTSGVFMVPPSGTINITYSAVPTWRWWGL